MLLVTGITGHSGGWLAKRMARERYAGSIRCVVRTTSDAHFLDSTPLNISKFTGDITDPEFLGKISAGVDTVLHIASIRFSKTIVEAAIRNGVRRAILVHTTGRFSKFKSAAEEYTRIENEILALRARIAITILRPTMIYGSSKDLNMYKLIDYLYRHKFFPVFGNGNNLMQPVHARDLGDAYFDVLMKPNATSNREYNLPGRDPIRYIDLVRTISSALGTRNVLVPIPMSLSIFAAKAYNQISSKAAISVEQVMRMSEDKAFAYETATKDFGYSPMSFREGVKEEVEEYLKIRNASA